MKPDNKVNSTRLQKNFLRNLIRDERLHPNKRFLAVLLLSHLEETHPRALLESLIKEQFGTPEKAKIHSDGEGDIETALDSNAAKELKEEWKTILMEENNASSVSTD
jgi:hypothetical protein